MAKKLIHQFSNKTMSSSSILPPSKEKHSRMFEMCQAKKKDTASHTVQERPEPGHYETVEPAKNVKTETLKLQDEFNEHRKLLKLYFYPAFRWKNNVCSFHLIYFLVFLVQIIKVALITGQMVSFGHDRANFSNLVNRGHLTLRHMLLENWSATRETPPYPPSIGEFAVYRLVDVESGINYAVSNYYNIQHNSMGYYTRTKKDNISMTIKYYQIPNNATNGNVKDLEIQERKLSLKAGLSSKKMNGRTVYNFDVIKHFQTLNLNQPMQSMLSTELYFTLHSVRVFEEFRQGKCLHVQGWVTFHDADNNGQVIINLETLTSKIQCSDININITDWSLPTTSQLFGTAVIAFSSLSIIITVTEIAFMCFVCWKTKQFMRRYYNAYYKPNEKDEKDLPMSEYLKFLKFWTVIIIISDILTLFGTSWIVNHTEQDNWIVETLDYYTVWLSFGGVFGWLSLFRFFKFHNKFNLLFSTLYRAIGDVLAYLLCVMVLFTSFWICGYVVLNPYHVKFSTPTLAAETLTSIVNGDEIFATLAMLENAKTGGMWVWWFSRIYILSYVAIFTIVVINLLIAIYMSAYETMREYYKTRPDERSLGSLEKALRGYLREQEGQHGVRSSIYELLSGPQFQSPGAKTLKHELGKLVRLDENKKDIVLLKTKTLKSFMNDEQAEVTDHSFGIGLLKFSFLSFPKRG